MSDDQKQPEVEALPVEEPGVAPPPEVSDAPEPEKPQINWEQRDDFGINREMTKVVNLTISATQAEIQALRRKLEKLQYGS